MNPTSKPGTTNAKTLDCAPFVCCLGVNCLWNNSSLCINVFKSIYGSLKISLTRHKGNNPEFSLVTFFSKVSPTINFGSWQWIGPYKLPFEIIGLLMQVKDHLSKEELHCLTMGMNTIYESCFEDFPNQHQYLQSRGFDSTILEKLNPDLGKAKPGLCPPNAHTCPIEILPSTNKLRFLFTNGIPQPTTASSSKKCTCHVSLFSCTMNFFYFQTRIDTSYCNHGIDLTLARLIPTKSLSSQVVYKPADNIPVWFNYDFIKPLITDYEWLLINATVKNHTHNSYEFDYLPYITAAGIQIHDKFELFQCLQHREALQDTPLASLYYILGVKPTNFPWLLTAPITNIDDITNATTLEEKLFSFFVARKVIKKHPNNSEKYQWVLFLFVSIVSSLDQETRLKFLEILPAVCHIMLNGHRVFKSDPIVSTSPASASTCTSACASSSSLYPLTSKIEQTKSISQTLPNSKKNRQDNTISTPITPTTSVKVTNKTDALSSQFIFTLLDEIEKEHPNVGKLFHIKSLNEKRSYKFPNQMVEISHWNKYLETNCTNAWITYRGDRILTGSAILSAIDALYGK